MSTRPRMPARAPPAPPAAAPESSAAASATMRRVRRVQSPEKENAPAPRESRPWDNSPARSPPKPVLPAHPPRPASQRFVPLRPRESNERPPPAPMGPRASIRAADFADAAAPADAPADAPPKTYGRDRAFSRRAAPAAVTTPVPPLPPAPAPAPATATAPLNEPAVAAAAWPPNPFHKQPAICDPPATRGLWNAEQHDDAPPSHGDTHSLKTRIGNRQVKPLIVAPNPPPIVGLPVPITNTPPSSLKKKVPPPPLPPVAKPSVEPVETVEPVAINFDDEEIAPRFSFRHSVRMPPAAASAAKAGASATSERSTDRNSVRHSARQSVRMSTRIPKDFNFLPESSSFLEFDDDARLSTLESPSASGKTVPSAALNSAKEDMSFSDPDTFDTFGSLPLNQEDDQEFNLGATAPKENRGPPDNGDNTQQMASPKPAFPNMSFNKRTGPTSRGNATVRSRRGGADEDEDDGEVFDIPTAMTRGPRADGALRDLQRASVTAGNEIAAQVRRMNTQNGGNSHSIANAKNRISRAQGEIEIRSRILRRWNVRYVSIVDHAYFGAVLFLFRHDPKASRSGTVALKNSKMIVLADSSVREVDLLRKNGPSYLFELRTERRKYVFACADARKREYWLDSLTSFGG